MVQQKSQLAEAVGSFVRAFASSFGAAILATWQATPDQDVMSWGWTGTAAFVAAVLLTAANALRTGDTRFGRGAVQ